MVLNGACELNVALVDCCRVVESLREGTFLGEAMEVQFVTWVQKEPLGSLESGMAGGRAAAALLSLVLPPAHTQSCAGHPVLPQGGDRSTPESALLPAGCCSAQYPESSLRRKTSQLGRFSVCVTLSVLPQLQKQGNGVTVNLRAAACCQGWGVNE